MDAFRGEYEKLFNTLEKSNRNEKRLRTKCKELGSEIAQHVAKVDLTNDKAKEDQDTIESLKKEIEKAWKMVDTAQEGEERARETIETLNTEIQNLTKVIEEKTLGAEDTNINELRKLRDELTQQRDNLQLEVSELKTKFEANEAKVEALTKEKADQVQSPPKTILNNICSGAGDWRAEPGSSKPKQRDEPGDAEEGASGAGVEATERRHLRKGAGTE